MSNLVNGIVKLYFTAAVLGVCTIICLLPTSPLLVICEKKQARTKDFRKSSLWAIAFCVITLVTLVVSVIMTAVAMRQPYVSNILQGILDWIAAVQG